MEFEERNYDNKELKSRLLCYEEELCRARKKLDECLIKYNELCDAKGILEIDLKCTKTKLADEKIRALCLEEKLKLEGGNSTDFKSKCRQLNELEERCNELVCKLNNEKYTVKILTTTLKELKEASENSYCKMKCQIQMLKKENSELEDELGNTRKKIKYLRRDYESSPLQINARKMKFAKKFQLK